MATLYLTEPGLQLHKEGQRLLVKRGQEVIEDIPMIKVERVILMGRGVGVTTPVVHALTRSNIEILYLNRRGGFISRLIGRDHNHSRVRFAQSLAASRPDVSLRVAKRIVEGKVHNQFVLAQRHAGSQPWAADLLQTMKDMQRRVDTATTLDEVRGLEGTAARAHFAILRRLLQAPADGETWGFDRRAYYPPTDPINALLSFGYTLLLNELVTACQIAGLDTDIGFFHAIDFGKPSMALDLEEEFRPIIVDSLVLAVINRGLLRLGDFEAGPKRQVQDQEGQTSLASPYFLKEEARNNFLAWYERRVSEQSFYQPSGETTSYRRIFSLQAYQMVRTILGQISNYTPFTVR